LERITIIPDIGDKAFDWCRSLKCQARAAGTAVYHKINPDNPEFITMARLVFFEGFLMVLVGLTGGLLG